MEFRRVLFRSISFSSIPLVLSAFAGLLIVASGTGNYQRASATGSGDVDTKDDVKRPVSLTRLEAFRLENGLQVIAIPFPDTETVTIMVWYKAGSAVDPHDKPGVAHFVEHAQFAAMGDHTEYHRRTTRCDRDHEPGEHEQFQTLYYTT